MSVRESPVARLQSCSPRRAARSSAGVPDMQRDYALVLNAGSSSLKFCVYEQSGNAPWGLTAKGAIDGIGASSRLRAMNAGGETLVNERSAAVVRDAYEALHLLASW